jgi:hypothetical protein
MKAKSPDQSNDNAQMPKINARSLKMVFMNNKQGQFSQNNLRTSYNHI